MHLNAAEVMVSLAENGPGPLRIRLARALRDAVRNGQLAPGATLPSSRLLAGDLGVSRGVVVDAYAQLAAEGFLLTQPGGGTTVASLPMSALPPHWGASRPVSRQPAEFDLRPGWPDLAAFPRKLWSDASRFVLRTLPVADLGYSEPWGTWALRRQLASYLARVRGAMTAPDGVVVVSGVTQGITLMCRLLMREGPLCLAVEDPSNALQRQLLTRLGVQLVDIPVDDQGLQVDALAQTPATVVLCTPAHQYPTGVALSPQRREQLLRWAARVNGLVLEDDFDAEFRYHRSPAACLQSMDPEHVALLGSVSKTLAPALRLGWVATPPRLLPMLRAAKRDDDFGSNALEQQVLARLLEQGSYDRHLRGLRRRYRERREVFVQAMRQFLPQWQILGGAGGLHLAVLLPTDLPEQQLVAAAAHVGVAVLGLGPMSSPGLPGRSGIVLSFARTTTDMAQEAVLRLVRAVELLPQLTPAMPARAADGGLVWNEAE